VASFGRVDIFGSVVGVASFWLMWLLDFLCSRVFLWVVERGGVVEVI
jgi:hypothetical protein